MKIIIAPAKKMTVDSDSLPILSQPTYLDATRQILQALRQLTYDEAKALWHCSDKLARPNYDWLQQLDVTRQLSPAVLAYTGIQYQYMAPDVFTQPAIDYVQHSLRILSGFYGILRPFDGIVPYRLEMQSKLPVADQPNLYDFWGSRLYDDLYGDHEPVINLASKEYAKAIEKYLRPQDQLITITFGTLQDGRLKTRATLAKMARGEMVRFMAEKQVTTVAALKQFDHLDYRYAAELSTADQLVFVK